MKNIDKLNYDKSEEVILSLLELNEIKFLETYCLYRDKWELLNSKLKSGLEKCNEIEKDYVSDDPTFVYKLIATK